MPRSRIPSPARSQGVISTPRKHTPRRSRSVCSAKSSMSVRLTAVIGDSFKLSPMPNRRSVLNDDTNIEVPGRMSWWKNLGENSRDVMDVLEHKDIAVVNNVPEELFDVEIISQEKKDYTLDLPESSDCESIKSIVIPQRKLFTQNDNHAQKKFGHIINNRETLAKLQKSHFDQEKDIDIGPKNLFNQASKPRTKPAFPAALLNISSKTLNKTKEIPTAEVKGQVRNLFGNNQPGMKRKNMFANFIMSDSEDEIQDIQPKVFGFQKKTLTRRESSASRGVGHSPTSSIDLELDEWKLLPSSTMVENQLEEATTPVKRARLSKLSEAKESETNINSMLNKTKQSNKSVNSKNKFRISSNSKLKENIEKDLDQAAETQKDFIANQNNQSLNHSSNVRLTRSKSNSMRESSLKEGDHSARHNKSKNTLQSKRNISVKALVHESDKSTKQGTEAFMETNLIQNEGEIPNESTEQAAGDDDEDFTLEYENDDEQIIEPIATNIDNINYDKNNSKPNNDIINTNTLKNKSNENNDLVDVANEVDVVTQTKTTGKETIDKSNEEKSPKQNGRDEQDNANTHIAKQEQHNKQQDLHLTLVKDSEKIQNKSKHEQEINQSKNTGKYKNVTDDNDIQETTQKEEENKNKIDSQRLDENVNKEIENEEQDESGNVDDDSKNQNENEDTRTHEQEDQNECIDEASIEIEEDKQDQTQNEIMADQGEIELKTESRSESRENETAEKQNEFMEAIEKENESLEANEEENESMEANEEQNESREANEEENESMETNEEENESMEANEEENESMEANDEETESMEANEEENESMEANDEEIESMEANEEENESIEANEEENESIEANEEENESMEANEEENEAIEANEENESEVEEENKSKNQDESVNSDDNVQNESNLSLNENEQGDEVNESDQEQSNNDIEGNDIDEVANETSNDHDTTGRHRKKNTSVKSPEAILHDKTNQIESFTAQGRNTSVRKTKSIIRNLNIRPSLAPVRESTGLSDGTRDSSAEGSGWDSHRTTRKTIRLTLGKDFTPRKSLRALVMEKSAKRNTNFNVTTKIPQANSTELPAFDSYHEPDAVRVDETDDEPSEHEVSARTRQTTLEMYLQKIKQENLERWRKTEEKVKASLKVAQEDVFTAYRMPPTPPMRRAKPIQNKPKTQKPKKQIKSSVIPLDMLPAEVLEDMKYKPPKRFAPASWTTKRLYKFLETKLEPKYDYKARVRAERLVARLHALARELRRGAGAAAVDAVKREMARLDIVRTHHQFYEFVHEYMPREIRIKIVPDIVNELPLPRNVFGNIIE